mmetsp:Transcript_71230/g.119206  ORF Transcript_71230/g.119206 Transcript_71230/m.119206 type:complete len:97 (+) Transcript_71230:94-384(+)
MRAEPLIQPPSTRTGFQTLPLHLISFVEDRILLPVHHHPQVSEEGREIGLDKRQQNLINCWRGECSFEYTTAYFVTQFQAQVQSLVTDVCSPLLFI